MDYTHILVEYLKKERMEQMKKLIIVAIIVIIFQSCISPVGNYSWEGDFNSAEILSVKEQPLASILWWVNDNIKYKPDTNFKTTIHDDDWQSPEETYTKRTGDCEDRAILAMYLIKKYLGIESELFGIREANGGGHAVIGINGVMYDVSRGDISGEIFTFLYRMPYANAMDESVNSWYRGVSADGREEQE